MRDLTSRSLPAPVLARLADVGVDLRSAGLIVQRSATDAGIRPAVVERRDVDADVEAREDDDTRGLSGYATTLDQGYDVYGGPERGGWVEMFARGSLDKTVAESPHQVDDCRFLVNHDGLALARTNRRTLLLTADDHHLRVDIPALNMARSDALNLWHAVADGDCDQMSLAFVALRQEWNEDYTQRVIREARLYDVSAVTYPANPNTAIGVRVESSVPAGRSLRLAIAELDALGV